MLSQRMLTPELMDAPDLERQLHWHALDGLARINRWSRSAAILWSPLAALAREKRQPLRVLDIATGAGDVPLALAARAEREALPMQFDACDLSCDAIQYAEKVSHRAGRTVRFFTCDIHSQDLPRGYDVAISSLFLHHLEDDQAIHLLRRMAEAATDLVLVNDLRRSQAGWWLAFVGTRLLSRSPIVHVDGPRSVERAFTPKEARRLAQAAGLDGAVVTPRWPCRWLLTWRKTMGTTRHDR